MKSLAILALIFGLVPSYAHAFGASEDESMAEDITEAISRAKDFSAQKVREATEDLKRERAAGEVKKDREEFEAEQEKARADYIRERNARPSTTAEDSRLERAFDQSKIVEDHEMDQARRLYLKKRAKVDEVIRKKAHIDENQEYGL